MDADSLIGDFPYFCIIVRPSVLTGRYNHRQGVARQDVFFFKRLAFVPWRNIILDGPSSGAQLGTRNFRCSSSVPQTESSGLTASWRSSIQESY